MKELCEMDLNGFSILFPKMIKFLHSYVTAMKPSNCNGPASRRGWLLHWARDSNYYRYTAHAEAVERQVHDSTHQCHKQWLTRTVLTSDDYNVTTMLIPKFKVNLLQPTQHATMKDMLIRAVQSAIGEQESSSSASSSSCDPADDSIFSFMKQTAADNSLSTRITAEVDSYLASHSTDMHVSSHCSSISKIQCRITKQCCCGETVQYCRTDFDGQTLQDDRQFCSNKPCFWDTNWKMTNGRLMFVVSLGTVVTYKQTTSV